MFCAKCGKEIKEGAAFCASCGTPVGGQNPAVASKDPENPQMQAAKDTVALLPKDVMNVGVEMAQKSQENSAGGSKNDPKSKKGKKVLLLSGIFLVIAVVVAGIILFFYFRDGDGDEDARSRRNGTAQSGKNQGDQEPEESEPQTEGSNVAETEPEMTIPVFGAEAYRNTSLYDIMTALDAYQRYLDQAGFSDSWGYSYYGCDLIYVDNDDIPEVVICGAYEAAGNIILTYDGNQVHEQYLGRLGFDYMERMNRLCNSDGHMGYYYDVVYAVVDGQLTVIGDGYYQEVYDGHEYDDIDDFEFEYFWNEKKVSYEEYRDSLDAVFPFGQYPVKAPMYYPYLDGFDEFYESVYDAYYAGISRLVHTLGWINENPLVAYDNGDQAVFCSRFMLESLAYADDIAKKYPNSYTQDWWLYIYQEDVRDFLMHSIGRNDVSELIQIAYKDPDNIQPYVNYIDGMFIMTLPDSGAYSVWDPIITEISLLSDTQLQVSGTIKRDVMEDSTTSFFTVRLEKDPESAWNYRLLGIDAWDTYLLPYVDSQLLTEEDVSGWSAEHLRLARNEIYARHGRMFADEQLQSYFEGCNWYHGIYAPADFDDSVLNEFEIANRDFIVQYETDMGYR